MASRLIWFDLYGDIASTLCHICSIVQAAAPRLSKLLSTRLFYKSYLQRISNVESRGVGNAEFGKKINV